MIMALYKVKSDAIPQAYAVEITKAIPIRGPKLNKYPNFTESMHLILCLATVAFWELTRQDCSVRDGALTIHISVAGLYAIDYYSGFDRRPGDRNERCLYLPRFILYLCTGVLYMIRGFLSNIYNGICLYYMLYLWYIIAGEYDRTTIVDIIDV